MCPVGDFEWPLSSIGGEVDCTLYYDMYCTFQCLSESFSHFSQLIRESSMVNVCGGVQIERERRVISR